MFSNGLNLTSKRTNMYNQLHSRKSLFSHSTRFSHGTPEQNITPDFMTNGYAIVRKVLTTNECLNIRSDIESRFMEQARSLNISLSDYFKYVNRWRDPSPLVLDVERCIKSKILPYVRQLYGEEVCLQKSDIVIKTRKCSSIIPLHQDISYHSDNPYQLTSWLSLSLATQRSAGVYLIPGSHIYGINKAVDLVTVDGENHDSLVSKLFEKDPIDVETEVGDVLFIDSKIWHGSRAYSSSLDREENIRISVLSRWKHPSFKSVKVQQEDSFYNRRTAKNIIMNIIREELGYRENTGENISDIDLLNIYINKFRKANYNHKLISLLEGLKINLQAGEKFFADDLQGNLFKALKFYFREKISSQEDKTQQISSESLEKTRKTDHIEINIREDVQSGISSGFERFEFVHNALPEINYQNIDTTTNFLGRKLRAPILISSMTGGTNRARDINYRLAEAAQKAGIAMGLGSMRVLLKEPDMIKTFSVRHIAPDVFLMANLGAVQLNYGVTPKECQQLVDAVDADALILHLNVLQELTQPEGDKNWENLLFKIKEVVESLSVPVVIKEVGYGLSEKVSKDLIGIGVKALDVAGSGGTSWSQVEAYRSTNELQNRIARSFINWGIPTLDSLHMVRKVSKDIPLIASGGIKSGIEGAKSLYSGANIFGIARPFLRAADTSEKAVSDEIRLVVEQLKISMLCTGSCTISDLKNAEIRN